MLIKDSAVYGATDFLFCMIAFALFEIYACYLTVGEFDVLELLMTGN